MRLVTATPNALYCDTDQVLTAAACNLLLAHGIRGVWRYPEDVTVEEHNVILASGLEEYFVGHAHAPGWQASAAGGQADGQRQIAALTRLGIPQGVHLAFDLEGPASGIPAVISHVTSHANVVLAAKCIPALYVGEGALLSSAQLFQLPSQLYWAAVSRLVDAAGTAQVPWCGYSVYQGDPFDVVLDDGAGTKVTIDYDYVKQDFQGRLPIGVAQ
jgi:hypothetical protein